MTIRLLPALLLLLMLTGCNPNPFAEDDAPVRGGTIKAVNHTHWAINHFSVNGQSGIDLIGPWQGGGGGCCFGVPPKWTPGMTVRVDWETGLAYSPDFPGYGDDKKYLAWAKKVNMQKKQHSLEVPVPDYTGQETCGITVHFLPCDDIKVTTSCYEYGRPDHPVKDPIRMEEPEVCPQ